MEATASTQQDSTKDLGGTFSCAVCSMQEHFDYKGSKPPFAKHNTYLEDCYIMKDPFDLTAKDVLVLGGHCSSCNKSVCLGCSVFYHRRFCFNCVTNKSDKFPVQVKSKVKSQ